MQFFVWAYRKLYQNTLLKPEKQLHTVDTKKPLHDPKNLRSLEYWCYSILRPCRISLIRISLRAQRGSHIPTLRPKYIPYTYIDLLGNSRSPWTTPRAIGSSLPEEVCLLAGSPDLAAKKVLGLGIRDKELGTRV